MGIIFTEDVAIIFLLKKLRPSSILLVVVLATFLPNRSRTPPDFQDGTALSKISERDKQGHLPLRRAPHVDENEEP